MTASTQTPTILVCPLTKAPLHREGDFLVAPNGTRYPIKDNIPILLPTAAIKPSAPAVSCSESSPTPTPDPGNTPE